MLNEGFMFDCQSPPFTLRSRYVNLSLIMKNYRVLVGLNVVSSKSITMNDGGGQLMTVTNFALCFPSLPHPSVVKKALSRGRRGA